MCHALARIARRLVLAALALVGLLSAAPHISTVGVVSARAVSARPADFGDRCYTETTSQTLMGPTCASPPVGSH